MFPIIKHPTSEKHCPILVSIPHYGTQPLPHITVDDYSERWFTTFAYGFADTFVGDLYGDLHEEGATVLATPFSRIFVDVNRRRDDFEQEDNLIRSHRGVVRTHTIRDAPIFTHALQYKDLEKRLATFYDPYYTALGALLSQLRTTYGYALLLDGHTGSPRRMQDYQVIIGTSHGKLATQPSVLQSRRSLPRPVLPSTTTFVDTPGEISCVRTVSRKHTRSMPFSWKLMPPC